MTKIGLFVQDCGPGRVWSNGNLQQPLSVWQALNKTPGVECVFVTHDLSEIDFGCYKEATRRIDNTSDDSDLDYVLFISTEINGDEIYDKWDRQGVKTISLLCGNWLCILNEDLVHDCHCRFENSLFNRRLTEFWTMPNYANHAPFIRAITCKPVSIFPYLWTPDIAENLVKNEKLNIKYNNFKPYASGKINILLSEPNLSVHKTCLIPLAICEEVERRFPDLINRVYLISKPNTKSFEFYLSKLKVGKKVEAHDRLILLNIMGQLNAMTPFPLLLSHHTDNPLNYIHLEANHYGWPIVHSSQPLQSIGKYYNDDNVEAAANHVVSYAKEFRSGKYKPKKSEIEFEFNAENPIVHEVIRDLLSLR